MSLESGLSKLVSLGLQAKLIGDSIIGASKVEFNSLGGIVFEEDPFIVYQDNESGFWLAALGGPGHSSTILKLSTSIDDTVASLIAFFRIKSQSALLSEKIQRLIWDLQRIGLATQVRQDAIIEVFCEETQEVNPYEFMISHSKQIINHSRKIEISALNEFWLLRTFQDVEQIEELLVDVNTTENIISICQKQCNK
ncbi:MAG: hypothetical protein GC179_22995 [Anaerolineaceae bacterium]|nr:hypothetical protein [Anaerolineaceae bacterium]